MAWKKKDDIERLLAELALNNFEAESLNWVDVVHVVNPLDFYVRPVKYNKLVESYKKMTPATKYTTVNINDMVIYNLSQFNGERDYFTRGRVSKINFANDHVKCDIYTIDYGYTDKSVPLEHLWHCPPDLLNTPALAYNSQLANCYPVSSNTWSATVTKEFKYHLGHGRVKMTILGRTSNKLVVKLMNTNLKDVATLLAIGGYSTIGPHNDSLPWKPLLIRKRYTFKFKQVQLNTALRVRMLSGRSFDEFYVKEVEDYEKFLKDVSFISFYARREFPLLYSHMVEGAIVCVKDDEKNIYHRAIIKKVTELGSKSILQLVDWGRDEEFSVNKMKYMSKSALKSPITTIFCKTTNSENHAWDLENFLTPGFEFYITIKRLGHEFEGPHTVEISPIEDEICQGATALPEETDQNIKIETEDEICQGASSETEKNTNIVTEDVICQGASSCVGNTMNKRPFDYGNFQYLTTPDISPNSEEEDDLQGTVTWQKLFSKRKAPFKGRAFKYVIPKNERFRYEKAYEPDEGPSPVVDKDEDDKDKLFGLEIHPVTTPKISKRRRRRLADDVPKDYKVTKSPTISDKHETSETGHTVESEKNLDLNFECLNLKSNTKESGEKTAKSEEYTDSVNESKDCVTE